MPSRRYYMAILPVEHINGKMAPVAVKCPNTSDPAEVDNAGFWYGYRIPGRSASRFGIRTKSRLLTAHPYTPAEQENRTLFALSLQSVREHANIAPDWRLMLADFDNQREYISPQGYAVARCRDNGGEWPREWIAD